MAEQQRATTAAASLLQRLLPERAAEFAFEWIPAEEGNDVFEIETVDGAVVLRGPNGVAQASALHWYLKYTCHCQFSWQTEQLHLPSPLPAVPKTRVTTPYRYRYYFNYCTFSYSAAFWDWARWEREIDWMALHGINLPLAITGQEAIWRAVYRRLGLTDDELAAFFVGPAYLPFGWMGCLDGWGGPLPPRWIDDHADLQRQILVRQRELGMTPVLQGFTGHVPAALAEKFPGSQLYPLRWADVGHTVFLDPHDPLFRTIGTAFIEEQTRQFGTDHFYAADTFIEMPPTIDDPRFIADLARAIFDGMVGPDPQAHWVMQAWPFRHDPDFWRPAQVEALLTAIPEGRALLLDLWAEQQPVWRRANAFHGQPWIWCMLHNFGGRPGLYGKLPEIAAGPPAALADPRRGNLCGVGLAMEAIEQNPIVYDLMAEMAWHRRPVELDSWVRAYVRRRYGAAPPAAERAWELLQQTVYGVASRDRRPARLRMPKSVIGNRPGLYQSAEMHTPAGHDDALPALVEAWRLLLACADEVVGQDPYRYDLADVAQHALTLLAGVLHGELCRSFEARDRVGLRRTGDRLLALIRDVDALLATRGEFLLGRWLAAARRWGATADEQALYERNARLLVTTWATPDSFLHDYSCRHWAGLLGDFYLPRWERFVRHLDAALAEGHPFDTAAFDREVQAWEWAWTQQTKDFPTAPVGDTVAVARALFERYRPLLPTADVIAS